jgi:hypothetical protein
MAASKAKRSAKVPSRKSAARPQQRRKASPPSAVPSSQAAALAKKATGKKATGKKATGKKATAPAKKASTRPAPKRAPLKVAAAPVKKALPKKAARPAKKELPKTGSVKKAASSGPSVRKPKASTPARAARQALTQKRAIAAALAPPPDGSVIVDAYLRDVDHPFKAEMSAVREIILGVSPKISERIKWNAPSFFYKDDLGAFNPRATEFAHLILLFPDGQGMQDSSGLLEGQHKDRREVKFHGMDDVKKKKPALERLIKRWVALRD